MLRGWRLVFSEVSTYICSKYTDYLLIYWRTDEPKVCH